jgi:hypothetical protein
MTATQDAAAPEAGEETGHRTAPAPEALPKGTDGATPEAGASGAPPAAAAPAVIVRALQPIRWRIGRRFGPEPVAVPLAELDEAALRALREDPLLVLTEPAAPPDPPAS